MIGMVIGSRSDRAMILSIGKELENYFSVKYYNVEILELGKINIDNANKFIESVDQIFVLGDRWEIAQITMLAVLKGKKIIHQGGGEISDGSYDNIWRKWIETAADVKFSINTVGYQVGSPRMDYLKYHTFRPKKTIYERYKLNTNKKTALVMYYPATVTKESPSDMILALNEMKIQTIVLLAPCDKDSLKINTQLSLGLNNSYKEIPHEDYIDLISSVDFIIGNTSAGITEAPSFYKAFINVGDRQNGREKLYNVIDCKMNKQEIINAINKVYDNSFQKQLRKIENIYSDGKASERIAIILKGIL